MDDEVRFVETLAKLLKKRGFDVHAAHDGRDALKVMNEVRVDVVLMDFRMPRQDGLDTLEILRGQDFQTPVLLLTGAIDLDQARKALKLGATEVLLKPCSVDMIVSAIENAHERKSLARELAEKEIASRK